MLGNDVGRLGLHQRHHRGGRGLHRGPRASVGVPAGLADHEHTRLSASDQSVGGERATVEVFPKPR